MPPDRGSTREISRRLAAGLAGRYRIERELGLGGMARVYLAEDLRHHRPVALKVLRPEIAAIVGAERFAREIEVAASLQHPHILPLLDSGQVNRLVFYVMPYVEGESLRLRLARGHELPIPEAVRILTEVADALGEAHAHGVVHRDIKPDNVMLHGRHALVTDFGVAKAVTAVAGQELLTSSDVAVGTPAYMAPEQATADQHQDHRVDIYALGVLGYELLTGRRPFAAATAPEMLAAHLTAEPEPLQRYRPEVPPALAQVILKCLAKRPVDRWQSAEDVRQQLERFATPSGRTPVRMLVANRLGRLSRWRKRIALVGVIVLTPVAIVFFRPRSFNIALSDIGPVTTEPGVEFQPAVSPDGKVVAYAAGPIAATHLVLRSTAGTSTGGEVHLGDSSFLREALPSWSSDGETVRFWGCRANGCAMYETGKLGGSVRPVDLPARRGLAVDRTAWSADGDRVAFVSDDTIFAASTTDTTLRRVVVDTNGRFGELNTLSWSPDGRQIAYVLSNPAWRFSGNLETSSIWLVSASGGQPQRVTAADHLNVSPVWLDVRHLLFVSDRDGPRGVYVVEVGPRGSRGEPRVVPGVTDPHSISYSISSSILAFSKFTFRQNIWSFPLHATAPVSIRAGRPVTTGTHVIESHDVSPDGRWIVFNDSHRGETSSLYIESAQGGKAVPLTALPWAVEAPRWSPDGTEIAFDWDGTINQYWIMVMPAKGGTPIAITDSLDYNGYPQWSPNGLQIAWKSSRTGRAEVWLVSRDSVGGTWHHPVRITDFGCFVSAWAPDDGGILCQAGSDLVALSPEGRVLWRRDVAGSSGLTFASYLPYLTRLSPDGRTLYTTATDRDGRRGIWAIPVYGGTPRLVVSYDDPALAPARFLSLGPDRLYLTVSEYESDIWVAKLRF